MGFGVWRRVERFLNLSAMIPGQAGNARGARLIGTDLANNKYYELPNAHGDLRATATRRFVEYAKDGTYQDHAMHHEKFIPVQWVLWLRHTRSDAPTLEASLRPP